MDVHVNDFFSEHSRKTPEQGHFHRVIALHAAPDVDWATVSEIVPSLPKGWYELCQLTPIDRIQFSLDYWMGKLPFHTKLNQFLPHFFSTLDDMGVFLTQKKSTEPFDAHMVYSLSQDRGFFRGGIPAREDEIIDLQKHFPDYMLPGDYLAFLQIHNGFCKATDCTGITNTKKMFQKYQDFQKLTGSLGMVITKKRRAIDPKTLIPFYESFGMPYYQCFWAEWYPEQEMGNVYYSSSDNSISEVEKSDPLSPERLAFPTFSDWLMFYLEQVEV